MKTFPMFLKMAIGMNVLHRRASLIHPPGHQHGTVALQRVFLSAHQCDLEFLHPLAQAFQALCKQWLLGQQVILDFALSVARGVFAARTELFSEKHIGDAAFLKSILQRIFGKLGKVLAVWVRANINQRRHAVHL